MAKIKLIRSPDWTVFRVEGDLSRDEIIDAVKHHYPHLNTKNIIWDLSSGSMDRLLGEDFHAIAKETKAVKRNVHAGKTAFVGSQNIVFTLVCMYTAVATMEEAPAEYKAFHTLQEAILWIGKE